MIKVNFNKKDSGKKGITRGVAPTGSSTVFTSLTEAVQDAGGILDTKSIVKMIINVLLVLAFPIGLKIYEIQEISKLTNKKNQEQSILDQKKQQLAQLQQELEQYAYLNDLANEYKSKRNFLKLISGNRLIAPRIIDFLQNQIPKDVWLTGLKIELGQEEKKITLAGYSIKEASINYFTNTLQSILHEDSISVNTQDVKDGQSDTILKTNFNLNGNLI